MTRDEAIRRLVERLSSDEGKAAFEAAKAATVRRTREAAERSRMRPGFLLKRVTDLEKSSSRSPVD